MAYRRILLQPANRSGDVAKQVLQTLSIIIQNVGSETGTHFLFSNNHVNRLISVPFDFADEEVCRLALLGLVAHAQGPEGPWSGACMLRVALLLSSCGKALVSVPSHPLQVDLLTMSTLLSFCPPH